MTAANLNKELLAIEDMLSEAVSLNHAVWLGLSGISDRSDQAALQLVSDTIASRLEAIVSSLKSLRGDT